MATRNTELGCGDTSSSKECPADAVARDFDARFETELPPPRHANLSSDATGRQWATLVAGAKLRDGAKRETCTFHPTDSCRMLGHDAPLYCSVCNTEVDRVLAHRAGERTEGPRCVVRLNQSPSSVSGPLSIQLVAASLERKLFASVVVLDAEGNPFGGEVAGHTTSGFLQLGIERAAPPSGTIVASCRDNAGGTSGVTVTLTGATSN